MANRGTHGQTSDEYRSCKQRTTFPLSLSPASPFPYLLPPSLSSSPTTLPIRTIYQDHPISNTRAHGMSLFPRVPPTLGLMSLYFWHRANFPQVEYQGIPLHRSNWEFHLVSLWLSQTCLLPLKALHVFLGLILKLSHLAILNPWETFCTGLFCANSTQLELSQNRELQLRKCLHELQP